MVKKYMAKKYMVSRNHTMLAVVLGVGILLLLPGYSSAESQDSTAAIAASFASGSGPSMTSTGLRMFGGLFLCLGVFALGVRLFKRYATHPQSATRRRIEIRERIQLSSKSSLLLVAVDDKEYLITRGSETVCIVPNQSSSAEMFAESLNDASDDVEAYNA
jgi:flagellar biogenesis protein FliO